MAKQWTPPDWFAPLAELPEYRRGNYAKTAEIVEVACQQAGIDPAVVVQQFCEYWPIGKLKHGWTSPQRALKNTVGIQIAKAKENGAVWTAQSVTMEARREERKLKYLEDD